MIDGKNNSLGYYSSEEAAARAYDECIRMHGLGRKLNFPHENVDGAEVSRMRAQ